MSEAQANPPIWPAWARPWVLALAGVAAISLIVANLAGASIVLVALFATSAGLLPPPAGLTAFDTVNACLSAIVGIGLTALAVSLIARHRRSRAAPLLGMVLLQLAGPGRGPPLFLQADLLGVRHSIELLTLPGGILGQFVLSYFLPLFCHEISGAPADRAQRKLAQAIALALMVMMIALLAAQGPIANSTVLGTLIIAGVLVLYFSSFWLLARNYRRSDAAGRNRVRIAMAALGCYLTLNVSVIWLVFFIPETAIAPLIQGFWNPLLLVGNLAGSGLFVYATLRRELFDFGFALNRALVYGALSFVLLTAFGLAEWGVEQLHLIPERWHEGGPIVSGGIALALFLSFHRLRDWIEHHVEKLLFHSWHVNEEALRRFVASAGHFDSGAALCKAFAREVSRFAQGAETALYLREASGAYRLGAGKLAGVRRELAGGDPLFARLRTERAPLRPSRAQSSLPGVLALPMLDQSALAGFVLLAGKGDGADYRPDEVQVLGWAAEQIGHALQAHHAHELKAELGRLATGNRALAEERDRLAEERDRLAALLERLAPRAVA